MENMKKTLSIAVSFDCKLKCEGCYLTTDVTKEMRNATKGDYYWERAFQLAVENGYEELAMTLNPFPGALEKCVEHAKLAKKVGFKSVNVTVTWTGEDVTVNSGLIHELLKHIDVLSESIDENRMIVLHPNYVEEYQNQVHFNINLLWSKKVFELATDPNETEWAAQIKHYIYERVDVADNAAMTICRGNTTMQHLILKPLSLYPSGEWFTEMYSKALDLDWLAIAGDGNFHIGDLAHGNVLGLNNCPGHNMMDIDPMGMVRRCPENAVAHDGSDLAKLQKLMQNGVPGCTAPCDCILPR